MSRRAQKKISTFTSGSWSLTTSTTYLYDGWNLIREIQDSAAQIVNYIWGLDLSGSLQGAGGIGGLLARVTSHDSLVTNYLYDGNGNVGQLVDSNGNVTAHYEYDPYGNLIKADGALAQDNPFRFSSKYLDAETGLYYYGYRYYSPVLGRWLNRDPIGEYGGINIYSFVENKPNQYNDILGLSVSLVVEPSNGPESVNIMKALIFYVKTICDKAKVDKIGTVTIGDLAGTQTAKGCCCLQEIVKSSNAWTVKGKKMMSAKGDGPYTMAANQSEAFVVGPGNLGKKGLGSGGLIETPVGEGDSIWQFYDKKGKLRNAPNWRILGHEICGHALPMTRGEHWMEFPGHTGMNGDRPSHDQAIQAENKLAKEHNQVERGLWVNPNHGESAIKQR